MNFLPPKSKVITRPTFSRERRFIQYITDAKRTTVVVGPGTYNFAQYALQKTRNPCLVSYVILFIFTERFLSCQNWF